MEQQQRESLPCGVRLIRHVLYRQRPDAAGLRAGKSQLHHRLLPGRSDDRAAHGIVKLVEQHILPEHLHPASLPHPATAHQVCHGHQRISLHQPGFRQTVLLLEGAVIGVTSLVHLLKSASAHRQFPVPDVFQEFRIG